MKVFGTWVVFWLVGAALVCLVLFSKGNTPTRPGVAFVNQEHDRTKTVANRKLKANGYTLPSTSSKGAGYVNVEDYRPIDPSPGSRATVRPGPIQHGMPLMPYIPKPSPPHHPKHGGSP